MASQTFSLPLPATLPDFARVPKPPAPIRRRTNPQQGHALEVLGHAIEYLVDTGLFEDVNRTANEDAVRLLMGCSRAVFEDCEEVFPWHQRVQRALMRRLYHERG